MNAVGLSTRASWQEYRPHYDAYDTTSDHGAQNTVRGGNRMITILIYLSDVESGGGTSFPNLSKVVLPKPGRVLVFHNCQDVKLGASPPPPPPLLPLPFPRTPGPRTNTPPRVLLCELV